MDNLAADFTIENNNPFEVEYELSENKGFDCSFTIFANPEKVSQLENDLNFQTETQVQEAIEEATEVINDRIDDVVNVFEGEIEDINTRMVDTVTGIGTIETAREGNSVTISTKTFVYEQGIASDTWVIQHNLNKHPSIELVDSAGTVFKAREEYNTPNQVTIYLNGATTGKAYLN